MKASPIAPSRHKTVFIHAGCAKTGTTAFQTFLKTNQVWMFDQGFCSPNEGRTPIGAHHPLARELCGLSNAPGQSVELDAVIAELKSCGDRHIILSSELIQRLMRREAFQDKISAFFETLGYRVVFLIYLRAPCDMVNSHYSQICKSLKQTKSLADYIAEGHVAEHIRYWNHLARRDNVNLILKPYTDAIKRDGVTASILDAIGVKQPAPTRRLKVNERPGPVQISLSRWFLRTLAKSGHNLSTRQRQKMRRSIQLVSKPHEPSGDQYWGLTEAFAAQILADTADSREELAKHAWAQSWENCFPCSNRVHSPCNDTDVIGPFQMANTSWTDIQSDILNEWAQVKTNRDLQISDPNYTLNAALADASIQLPKYA